MPTSDQPVVTAQAGSASAASAPAVAAKAKRDKRARGQIIVIFAASIIVFMGLSAIVIDVSWFLSSQIRMQRAADASALAGVVLLPGNVPGAVTLARTEASRNGYTTGVKGITVTPTQDPQSTRRMQVVISGPVNTYFARVLGFTSFNAIVTSKAEYILPVPMGSPENYYGVFGLTRGLTETSTVLVPTPTAGTANSGNEVATTAPNTPATPLPGVGWTASAGSGSGTAEAQRIVAAGTDDPVAGSNNAPYIWANTNGAIQVFGGFDLSPTLASGESVTGIRGLQVFLDDAWLSGTCGTSRIQVQVSEDAGTNWSNLTTNQTGGLSVGSNNAQDYNWGSANGFGAWVQSGGRTWNNTTDFSAANFRVRLTALKNCGPAGAVPEIRLDRLRVVASYDTTAIVMVPTLTTTTLTDVNLRGPGTSCPTGVSRCANADGAVLNPRGFWGTLNSQGAENINGDAHQPYYDTRTGQVAPGCGTITAVRACYDPNEYYNYAVEVPQGATGDVWIYDPGFCDVNTDRGTGDRWFGGTAGVTTMYEVWDTNNTLYDRGDDGVGFAGTTPNATSGGLFRNMSAADTTMGGDTSVNQCRYETDNAYGDGRDYHNHWYLLASGLAGGTGGPKIYRVHTTSTDPANVTQQRGTNAENSFAIYASASSGTPRVYGLGAMQAFTPLKSNGGTESSEFYLAQIEKVHAGKTVEISLWDPGDTTPLTASIAILIPSGASSWSATPVTYVAATGTNNSNRADGGGGRPNCNANSRTTPSTGGITTFASGGATTTGNFNGCWLTIQAVIPDNYQALAEGWWKIRYTMTGNGVSNDVTTWKVQILGNPVHLIVN